MLAPAMIKKIILNKCAYLIQVHLVRAVFSYGSTSFLLSTNSNLQTLYCLTRWSSCRQKSGKEEKEVRGRSQTEGIIVHAHSCGLPCSKNTSQAHDFIVALEQSLHPTRKVTYLKCLTSAIGYACHTHTHTQAQAFGS